MERNENVDERREPWWQWRVVEAEHYEPRPPTALWEGEVSALADEDVLATEEASEDR
jgi:hypothetical protein